MTGNQANVEYFFRLLYELLFGDKAVSTAGLSALLAHVWLWIIVLGYAIALIGFFFIIYSMTRIFELRAREKEFYGAVLATAAAGPDKNPRWRHIASLMESPTPSAWREAIIEADIMLDDMLARQGYDGEGVGEKLMKAEQADIASLQDAWNAHKVRNQIAHQGSGFDLSEILARRTVAQYEKVFREFEII